MRGLFFFLISWGLVSANAQPLVAGYEYWFNNNSGARVRSSVTATTQATISFEASTSGLPTGVHLFHIRGFDTNGKFSPTLSQFFYKSPPTPQTNNLVAGYEYWFNNNSGARVRSTVTATTQATISFKASTSGLPTGVHLFHIRGFDTNGKFSPTLSQFFYKMPTVIAENPHIMAYQYWLNNNFGNAVLVGTPAQAVITLNEMVNLNDLPTGIHSFSIRFKDNRNTWSAPMVQFFYKIPLTNDQDSKIVAYQFWTNNNFGGAVLVNTSPQQQLVVSELFNISSLGSGMHSFSIRLKDNRGLWSSPISQFFYRIPQLQGLTSNQLTAYRYWFNHNEQDAVFVELEIPVQPLDLIKNFDLARQPKGQHSIHFQFRDAIGLWSQVTTDVITKNPLPIADFSYTLSQHCDSTTISFTDRSIDAVSYLWNFGDGKTSNQRQPVYAYKVGGTYTVSLKVADPTAGLDSTLTRQIIVPVRKVDTGVDQAGIVLTSRNANATYQWLDCNTNLSPVQGQTGRSFTPAVNGRYAVEVTQDGCKAVSDCFQIISVSIPEAGSGAVRLFPNPNTGQFTIDLGKYKSNVSISVFDQHGRKASETHSDFGREFVLNLRLAPGIYFLIITANGETSNLKFVVN